MLKRPDVSTDEGRSLKAGQSFVYIRYVQKSVEHSVSGETTQLNRGNDAPCSLSVCFEAATAAFTHEDNLVKEKTRGTTPKYFHHTKLSL